MDLAERVSALRQRRDALAQQEAGLDSDLAAAQREEFTALDLVRLGNVHGARTMWLGNAHGLLNASEALNDPATGCASVRVAYAPFTAATINSVAAQATSFSVDRRPAVSGPFYLQLGTKYVKLGAPCASSSSTDRVLLVASKADATPLKVHAVPEAGQALPRRYIAAHADASLQLRLPAPAAAPAASYMLADRSSATRPDERYLTFWAQRGSSGTNNSNGGVVNARVTQQAATQVDISWSAGNYYSADVVAYDDSYRIAYEARNNVRPTTATQGTTQTHRVTGLQPGTHYRIVVTTYASAAQGRSTGAKRELFARTADGGGGGGGGGGTDLSRFPYTGTYGQLAFLHTNSQAQGLRKRALEGGRVQLVWLEGIPFDGQGSVTTLGLILEPASGSGPRSGGTVMLGDRVKLKDRESGLYLCRSSASDGKVVLGRMPITFQIQAKYANCHPRGDAVREHIRGPNNWRVQEGCTREPCHLLPMGCSMRKLAEVDANGRVTANALLCLRGGAELVVGEPVQWEHFAVFIAPLYLD